MKCELLVVIWTCVMWGYVCVKLGLIYVVDALTACYFFPPNPADASYVHTIG